MHLGQFLVNKGCDRPLLGKEGTDLYGSSKLKSILEPISRARHEYDPKFYKLLLKNLATSPTHPTLSPFNKTRAASFFHPVTFENSSMIAKFCHNQNAEKDCFPNTIDGKTIRRFHHPGTTWKPKTMGSYAPHHCFEFRGISYKLMHPRNPFFHHLRTKREP